MKHHLMIAGTGRAGTSFLVQYFHLCGVDTVIRKDGMARWSSQANAGLETYIADRADMPYVIKSGWFQEFVASILKEPGVTLDAVLIPMRDLVEAASSRVINDQLARLVDPSVPDECTTWERWGTTPGGIVYSLNPIDQARILALSFHTAIHALVQHGVPMVFLDFPRFVNDPDYLYESVRPYLPPDCTAERARAAHQQLADAQKVRTGRELGRDPAAVTEQSTRVSAPPIQYPTVEALNEIARRRSAALRPAAPSLGGRLAGALRRVRSRVLEKEQG